MEWNSINTAPFQKRCRLTHVNIATTYAIRCTATSELAYRHVAHLTAAVLGFLRCHSWRWSKTVTISTCWKIFSTVFSNSLYYQRAISDGSTVVDVGGANNRPCCAARGPVSTGVGRTSDGEEPTNQKPPQADFVAGARFFRHANRQSVYRPAYQLALLELVGVSCYPGTVAEQTDRSYAKI